MSHAYLLYIDYTTDYTVVKPNVRPQVKHVVSQPPPIIDEIDGVLAEHYGFTDEELDFIINYDIKYRMGGAAQGGDEE